VFEEVIAELGDVMLRAHLGLTPAFEQSAGDVESRLMEDKRDLPRHRRGSESHGLSDHRLSGFYAQESGRHLPARTRGAFEPL
jgi:hypothetical protein